MHPNQELLVLVHKGYLRGLRTSGKGMAAIP